MCELSRASVTVAALVANFEGEDDIINHHNGRPMRISKSGRRPPAHPQSSSSSTSSSNHNGGGHPIRKQRSGTLLVQESECSVTVTLPISSPKKSMDSEESSADSRNGASCSPPGIVQENTSTTSECSEEDTSTCSDADFTWICSQPESSPPPSSSSQKSSNQYQQNLRKTGGSSPSVVLQPIKSQQQDSPRSCSSLDRRRPASRALRDQKSRSTHTLRCDSWTDNNGGGTVARENRCCWKQWIVNCCSSS